MAADSTWVQLRDAEWPGLKKEENTSPSAKTKARLGISSVPFSR